LFLNNSFSSQPILGTPAEAAATSQRLPAAATTMFSAAATATSQLSAMPPEAADILSASSRKHGSGVFKRK
jgi:hypothetical protein